MATHKASFKGRGGEAVEALLLSTAKTYGGKNAISAFRSAVRSILNPASKEIKSAVSKHKKTGTLEQSVGVAAGVVRTGRNRGTVYAVTGYLYGKVRRLIKAEKPYKKYNFYGHVWSVERGSKKGWAPTKYIINTFNRNKQKWIDNFIPVVNKHLRRTITRFARRHGKGQLKIR